MLFYASGERGAGAAGPAGSAARVIAALPFFVTHRLQKFAVWLIQKMAPKAALRFMAIERVISVTMRNLQTQLETCDSEMRAAYEDAQKLITAMHIDDAAAE